MVTVGVSRTARWPAGAQEIGRAAVEGRLSMVGFGPFRAWESGVYTVLASEAPALRATLTLWVLGHGTNHSEVSLTLSLQTRRILAPLARRRARRLLDRFAAVHSADLTGVRAPGLAA